MADFFDLREFLIFALKKLKLILVTTLLLSAAWALVRLIPMAAEYASYQEPADGELVQETQAADNEPFRHFASVSIAIQPMYEEVGDTVVDRARNVADIFAIYWRPVDIVSTMQQEFYEDFLKADAVDKRNLVDYNYRTKAVFDERYLPQNFINSFAVERPADTIITLHCTGTDKELCERALGRYKDLMLENVRSLAGDFSYIEQEIATTSWLPEATAGLIPKTAGSLSSQNAAGVRPTLSQIAVHTAKGAVWGAAAGLAASIVLVFFFSVVSLAVEDEDDLKPLRLKLLGVWKQRKKKRLFRFIDTWIEKLQGRAPYRVDLPECCDIVRENILMQEGFSSPRLLLTSCGDPARVEEFAQALRESFARAGVTCTLEASECVLNHAQAVAACRGVDGVVLVEQAGASNKEGISKELDAFACINKPVLGAVFLG